MTSANFLILLAITPIPALIAKKKYRHFPTWLAFGFALWPIAILAALFLKKIPRQCPKCAEDIHLNAVVCRFCHSDLPPMTPDEMIERNRTLKEDSKTAIIKGLVTATFLVTVLVVMSEQEKIQPLQAPISSTAEVTIEENTVAPSAAAESGEIQPKIISSNEIKKENTMGPYNVEAFCQKIGNGSYAIEQACRIEEFAAKNKLSGIQIPERVATYCANLSRESYAIAEACVQEELKAKAML